MAMASTGHPQPIPPELLGPHVPRFEDLRAPIPAPLLTSGPPKAVNPKDGIGNKKLPLHLWPPSASAHGCLALLDGMLKYGRSNWRATDVRATVYIAAALRHILEYLEGADKDHGSGLHPLAHVLACCAIILDADATKTLIDDRNYPSEYHELIESLTPHVERLLSLYSDRTDVKHYTIQDKPHE
jgi:hypothetical protein